MKLHDRDFFVKDNYNKLATKNKIFLILSKACTYDIRIHGTFPFGV